MSVSSTQVDTSKRELFAGVPLVVGIALVFCATTIYAESPASPDLSPDQNASQSAVDGLLDTVGGWVKEAGRTLRGNERIYNVTPADQVQIDPSMAAYQPATEPAEAPDAAQQASISEWANNTTPSGILRDVAKQRLYIPGMGWMPEREFWRLYEEQPMRLPQDLDMYTVHQLRQSYEARHETTGVVE